jgi:hypothetical protein
VISLGWPRHGRKGARAASCSRAPFALFLLGLAVGGCDCGAPPLEARDASLSDAAPAADAPFSARDAGPPPPPEPCAAGMRRFVVDLPPLADASRSWEAVLAGLGNRVLVAQRDERAGRTLGRLSIADALTGALLRTNDAAVPLDGSGSAPVPLAIRDAGGGTFEVLWTGQGTPFAAILRHGPDGAESVVPDPSSPYVYWVHAACVTHDGFLALVELGSMENFQLVALDATGARMTPLALPFRREVLDGPPTSYVALADADARGVVFGAVPTLSSDGTTTGLTALRIDTATWPPVVISREIDRMDYGSSPVSVDMESAGPIVAMSVASPSPGVRFYWLDDTLSERARWQSEAGSVPAYALPIGSVGAATPRMLALASEFGFYVGLVDAPGIVRGATRPIVNNVGPWNGGRGQMWESAPGALSIGFFHAGAEVVTLCGVR